MKEKYKMLRSIIISLLFCLPIFGQNVHLKDGTIYKNVKILNNEIDYLRIKVNSSITTISKSYISKIDDVAYDSTKVSQIIEEKKQLANLPDVPNSNNIETYRPYKHLLWVSLLSAAIAWDSFAQMSNLSDQIGQFNKLKLDTGGLESEKSRKIYIGVAASIVTLALAILSFKEVEVKPNSNGFTFSYRL